jgi:predicted amidophosphoribosyltransferase
MADTGICPYCEKEFAVFQYGYRLACPKCKKPIDVFPDTSLWVETKWGKIGVSENILAHLCKIK